jgi:hypothetical protein
VVRHVLHGLGAHCLPLRPLEISQASRRFDQADQLTDPATRGDLQHYLRQLAEWLRAADARSPDTHALVTADRASGAS